MRGSLDHGLRAVACAHELPLLGHCERLFKEIDKAVDLVARLPAHRAGVTVLRLAHQLVELGQHNLFRLLDADEVRDKSNLIGPRRGTGAAWGPSLFRKRCWSKLR